jgi:hypothetical protein
VKSKREKDRNVLVDIKLDFLLFPFNFLLVTNSVISVVYDFYNLEFEKERKYES